ncbi:MAG TPA: ABC transporter permease [bacterium]
MLQYVVRRVIVAIPLLLAMSFVTFMFIQAAPGDYFDLLRQNPQISEAVIDALRAQYRLDQPPLIQYGSWLWHLLQGDLGYSFAYKAPVAAVIAGRIGNTLILTGVAMILAWLMAIPLGIYGAFRHQTAADRALSFFAYVGMSIPNFFLALLLLYLASLTGWLPLGGMRSAGFAALSWPSKVGDLAAHLAIPALVISTASLAGLQRLMRGNTLEVLRAPFVVTARAKGLTERRVRYVHVLRNAINPMITIFGYELSSLLGGAALTEIICSWPGLGSLMLGAVRQQDLFLVMGSMLMGGIMLLGGNLIADLLLAWSDPRIRYGRI